MISINKIGLQSILVCSIILMQTALIGQIDGLRVQLRTDSKTTIHPDAEIYKDKIIENLQIHLGKYNDAAFLIDIEEGKVNTKSIETFKSLFHSNARVFNDLEKYGMQIPIDDYVSKVAERMSDKGVEFKIADMLLKSVENNPALGEKYFEAIVIVNKLILSQLDEKTGKQVTIKDGGDVVTQEFTILIKGEDLQDVNIYGINGRASVRPKPYNHEVRVAASYGLDVNSRYQAHNGFATGFAPQVSAASMIDANIVYARGFKRNGHSKWMIGLGYGQQKWDVNTATGDVKSRVYKVAADAITGNRLSFNTSYEYTNVTNQVSFSYLQGLIGVQLPLKQIAGYKLEYWIEGAIMPTFITKNESFDNAKFIKRDLVTFDGKDDAFCDDDKFSVPVGVLDETSNAFSVGIQIKPYVRYYLNESKTTGLTIGAGYVYYLQSWVDKTSTSIHDNTIGPKSLILHQLTPAHLRLELGLSFKLNQ